MASMDFKEKIRRLLDPQQEPEAPTPTKRLCTTKRVYTNQFFYDEDDYDEDEERYWARVGKQAMLCELGHNDLLLRREGDYVLFRDANTSQNDVCFLTQPLNPSIPLLQLTPEIIEDAIRRRAVGRCLRYHDPSLHPFQQIFLFFVPDGTGFARDNWNHIHFTWDTGILPSYEDFLMAKAAVFKPVCVRIFWQIDHSLRYPFPLSDDFLPLQEDYSTPEEYKDIPRTWLCGSETALRQLTHAICCTEPDLFTSQKPVEVIYCSTLPGKRGGLRQVLRDEEPIVSGRLTSLCELAFRLNSFTGASWNFHRTPYYHLSRQRLVLRVAPPSIHERAETYLTLIEWLDETLYDPQKRAAFNLPPR